MKRLVWISIAVGILHACKPHTGYTIKGDLAGANGMKVTLLKVIANSDNYLMSDSCVVKKGKFMMQGNLECPEYCLLYVGDNGPIQMIVENTEMNVDVNLQNTVDSKVTGSVETDLLMEYSNNIALMDTMRQERIEYMKQFVAGNPNRIATAFVVNNYLANFLDAEALDSYADGMDDANSQSTWVQSIREKARAARLIAVGQPFADIRLPNVHGNEIALSDYAGKDKYVLIHFWASWCRMCRLANPHLVEFYKKYREKEFEIVGISLDRNKAEWTKAIQADSLKWPQMSDLKFWQSEAAKIYRVDSLPYNILLDKDGIILAKGFQPDESGKSVEMEDKLEELINENY